MTDQIEKQIEMILANSGIVEPVSITKSGKRVVCLCRGIPSEKDLWMSFVKDLLGWAEEANKSESIFVGKRFVLRNGNVVFGWHLEFDFSSAKELKNFVNLFLAPALRLTKAVVKKGEAQKSTPAQVAPQKKNPVRVISRHVDEKGRVNEIVEVPLAHVRGDLNVPTKPVWSETHGRMIGGGKGATAVGAK